MKLGTQIAGLLLFAFLVEQSLQQKYEGEGYFVVDRMGLETYLRESTAKNPNQQLADAIGECKRDVDYFLTQTNLLLETMKPGLDIQIRKSQVAIMEEDVITSPNGKSIAYQDAYQAFDAWLKTTDAKAKFNYDFAILLTGFDLEGQIESVSTKGGICNEEGSSGVVGFNGTYKTARNIARSFASICGAGFDNANSQYVMAPTSRASDRSRWEFSSSTGSQIKSHIQKNGVKCLNNRSGSSKPSLSTQVYEGELYNYDTVCEREMRDEDSYLCHSKKLYYGFNDPERQLEGDVLCTRIFCKISGIHYCKSAYATDGFICAEGKRCMKGKCLPDTSAEAANVNADCLLGDTKALSLISPRFHGTCQQFLAVYGKSYCYDRNIAEMCCESCSCIDSGVPGCAFGDWTALCSHYKKDLVCPYFSNLCCQTCSDWVDSGRRRRSTTVQLSPPANVQVEEDEADGDGSDPGQGTTTPPPSDN